VFQFDTAPAVGTTCEGTLITNKTATIPGKNLTGTGERWIEIKQGDTIRKAKYKINGVAVTEQPRARKTILKVSDDFSGYEKGTPVEINVYLTETATKPVATATVKVIDMPFKLVFFKTDHLGTPRVITDQDGKVLSTHDYLAYGEELTDLEFQTNRMKFTGHERDPETGLDYMLARYYTAGSGRFLQVDPGYDYKLTDPMSFNLYGYVRENPVRYLDSTGQDLEEFERIVLSNYSELKRRYEKACYENIEHGAFLYQDSGKYLIGNDFTSRRKRKGAISVSFSFPVPKYDYPATGAKPISTFHTHQNEKDTVFSPPDLNLLLVSNRETNGQIKYALVMDDNHVFGLEVDTSVKDDLSKAVSEFKRAFKLQFKKTGGDVNKAIRAALTTVLKKHKSLHFYVFNRKSKKTEEEGSK